MEQIYLAVNMSNSTDWIWMEQFGQVKRWNHLDGPMLNHALNILSKVKRLSVYVNISYISFSFSYKVIDHKLLNLTNKENANVVSNS